MKEPLFVKYDIVNQAITAGPQGGMKGQSGWYPFIPAERIKARFLETRESVLVIGVHVSVIDIYSVVAAIVRTEEIHQSQGHGDGVAHRVHKYFHITGTRIKLQ